MTAFLQVCSVFVCAVTIQTLITLYSTIIIILSKMAALSVYEQVLRNRFLQYCHIFPNLNYNDAVALTRALCQRCESPAPRNWDLALGPLPPHHVGRRNPIDLQHVPWSANLLRAQPLDISTQIPPPCGHPPVWVNAAAGLTEPSFCFEPPNQAMGGSHNLQHPLVCVPCKLNRWEDFTWKMDRLKLGVCKSCRLWALRPGGMAVGQNDCLCPPFGSYNGNWNNNEERKRHLCFDHFNSYWTLISNAARTEIDLRAYHILTRAPPRRGHGWTRRKQHGPRQVRTPLQRRLATRDPRQGVGGLPIQTAHTAGNPPKCYCGNPLTNLAHNWNPPMTLNADQVRNCVGCNQFWRTR